jgi:hypothetical protein
VAAVRDGCRQYSRVKTHGIMVLDSYDGLRVEVCRRVVDLLSRFGDGGELGGSAMAWRGRASGAQRHRFEAGN